MWATRARKVRVQEITIHDYRQTGVLTLLIQQYIVRFNVPMDNPVTLQIIERQRDFSYEQYDALLAEHNLLLDMVSQIAAQK